MFTGVNSNGLQGAVGLHLKRVIGMVKGDFSWEYSHPWNHLDPQNKRKSFSCVSLSQNFLTWKAQVSHLPFKLFEDPIHCLVNRVGAPACHREKRLLSSVPVLHLLSLCKDYFCWGPLIGTSLESPMVMQKPHFKKQANKTHLPCFEGQ